MTHSSPTTPTKTKTKRTGTKPSTVNKNVSTLLINFTDNQESIAIIQNFSAIVREEVCNGRFTPQQGQRLVIALEEVLADPSQINNLYGVLKSNPNQFSDACFIAIKGAINHPKNFLASLCVAVVSCLILGSIVALTFSSSSRPDSPSAQPAAVHTIKR